MKNIYKIAIIFSFLISPLPAYATKNVTSPYVDKGEIELQSKTGFKHDDEDEGQDGSWQQKLTVYYGLTDSFLIEVEGEIEKENGSEVEFSGVELAGKIQLTEEKQYWVDVGLKGTYEYSASGDPDNIELKLLLAKETGKFSHRTNLILEREVSEDAEDKTEVGISWSTRYRYHSMWEPGFEIYSGFGSISNQEDFNDQDHQVGPVFYGKLSENFAYDVGYLFGISDSAPDGEVKALFKYELDF